MLDDVYNAKIIEYAGNIPCGGRLEAPDATAKAHSKLCGSTVVVDLKMQEGPEGFVVTDFAHDVKACALGQASSSIMARNIIGASSAELKALKKQMYAMLKDGGDAPTGRFEEFKFLEPVREYKARHASTLLTFDAVVDCIEEIEAKAKSAKAAKKQNAKKHAINALSSAGIKFRVR
jgi:NifU-like protein involved in Fe-S cluster formation